MSTDPATEEKLLDAALALLARGGWKAASGAAIAEEAGLGLGVVYEIFPDRPAILAAMLRRADRAMLAGDAIDEPEAKPRDRLFETIMRRLDGLLPMRAAIKELLADGRRDPATLLCATLPSAPDAARSLRWLAEAARVPRDGAMGAARMAGLAYVYVGTFRAWLEDEAEDFGVTMKTLDKRLATAERWSPLFRPAR